MNTIEAYRLSQEHPEVVRQAQAAINALLSRSATDPVFRQTLLDDPRAAIAEHTGNEVPEGVNIVFVENKADTTIVLPDAIDPNVELTDEELEAVAGGEVGFLAGFAVGMTIVAAGAAIWAACK